MKLPRDPDNRLQLVPVHILHGEGRFWVAAFTAQYGSATLTDRTQTVLQKHAVRIRNAEVRWVVAGRSATVPRRRHRSERRTSKSCRRHRQQCTGYSCKRRSRTVFFPSQIFKLKSAQLRGNPVLVRSPRHPSYSKARVTHR